MHAKFQQQISIYWKFMPTLLHAESLKIVNELTHAIWSVGSQQNH